MRRLYILLFCILFVGLITNPCFSEKAGIDGTKWKSWLPLERLGWVEGFASGVGQTSNETWFHVAFIIAEIGVQALKTEERSAYEVLEEWHDDFKQRVTAGQRGTTVGQVIDGLDDFYKDYRNEKILVSEAVYIVNLELMGASRELVEQVTRIVRMPFVDRPEEQESLLAGNQEYKRAWQKWGKYLPLSVIPTSQ